MAEIRQHPRRGYDALAAQGGFPPEMLDVVLHHHEFLDGTGYPDGLRGDQISDIVRLTTIVDIYAALVEKRAYRLPFTHARAFAIMEEMGGKLDQQLLQAFRPVAFGRIDDRRPGHCEERLDAQSHRTRGFSIACTSWLASMRSAMTELMAAADAAPQTAPPHTPHCRRPSSAAT